MHFHEVRKFFQYKKLEQKHCVAVTTDGAAAMIGKIKGLNDFIKQKNPVSPFLYCMLHCKKLLKNT